MKFMTFELPLRPLLLATGAAATAVGVCFVIKNRGDKSVLQTGSGDFPALDETRDAQRDNAVPEVLEQMDTLLGSVQQLKEEVMEIQRICEQMKKERQLEQEARSILTAECDQLRDALNSQDELLNAEAKKYHEALDTKVQLEIRIVHLEGEMNKVNACSQQLEEDLSECQRSYKKEQWDQEILQAVHQNLISEYNSMETSLTQKIDYQTATVSQFERKIEQTRESAVQLNTSLVDMDTQRVFLHNAIEQAQEHLTLVQKNNNKLIKECQDKDRMLDKRNGFHSKMQDIMSKAAKAKSEFHTKCLLEHDALKEQHSGLLKEYEDEHEAHNALKSQYEHLMRICRFHQKENNEDAKRKLRLEKRNSELRNQAQKLKATARELKQAIHDSDVTCKVVKEDMECAQESFRILQSQCDETMKHHEDLLLEMEKERLAHSSLRMQCHEMMEALEQCNDCVNMDHINQDLEKIPAGGGV